MLKIGLTGSIGMGKSAVLSMFKELGVKTWDADASVHELYKKGQKGYEAIKNAFSDVINDDGVDRQKLAKIVINDDEAMKKLEAIIHPLVKEDRSNFIARNINEKYIIIDVPLLFETNLQNEFDKIIVVNCDEKTQEHRVMLRPNMTQDKFIAILAKQMPNKEKIAKSDFIIDTSVNIEETKEEVANLHNELLNYAA